MTDATARYLSRVLAPRWQILGVRLLPLTLGHAHLLSASTSWRPWETGVDGEALAPGLFICSRPWRKAAAQMISVRARLFALHLGWRAARRKVNMQERLQVFADYLEVHTGSPECRAALRPKGERVRPAIPSGMPLLVWLRLFACQELSCQEPLDMPFADLVWMWTAHLDSKGVVHTLNDDEFGFREWIAGQERQGGKPSAETSRSE
jgi:hypothetical protein